MTDTTDLIARLRAGTASPVEAADALEAQARRIALLEETLDEKCEAELKEKLKDENALIIAKQDDTISELRARIAELEAENVKLKETLAQYASYVVFD